MRLRSIRTGPVDHGELTEAIAVFTEHLRDTIVSATGLEQAMVTTLDACPVAIEPAVRRMVAEMQYGQIEDALRRFADELSHPASDFVVAALLSAVRNQTRDLAGLLTQLSASAREECALHTRVWVSRARTRSAVRIVAGSLFVFVVGLALLDPAYLAPYASPNGLIVLIVVGLGFVSGLALLNRMASFTKPARIIRERAL